MAGFDPTVKVARGLAASRVRNQHDRYTRAIIAGVAGGIMLTILLIVLFP